MRDLIDIMSSKKGTTENFLLVLEAHFRGRDVEEADPNDPNQDVHYDALHKTGFFGKRGAGCLAFARSTSRFLLMLRSQNVLESGTWGNCGGAVDENETNSMHAAERELREETGYGGDAELIPLLKFEKGSFVYHNYLAIVEDEFNPRLSWEADDSEWCDFGEWPSPLHFGMKALFSDAASVATMKSLIGK